MSTKKANYTPVMENAILDVVKDVTTYQGQQDALNALVMDNVLFKGKTGVMVRSKLAYMCNKDSKLVKADGSASYIKKQYSTKLGTSSIKKDLLASALAQECNIDDDQFSSLEKANKSTLQVLLGFIQDQAKLVYELGVEVEDLGNFILGD